MTGFSLHRRAIHLATLLVVVGLLFVLGLPPLAKGLVSLNGPGTTPNPNVNSVQAACPAGSSAALFSTSGATTNSAGHSTKTEQGLTLEWAESIEDGDGDGTTDDFVLDVFAIYDSTGEPIAYSRVFVFVGGNDTFSGTFALAVESNVGDDALLQTNQPNGLNITQFGFCVYQNSGTLKITKAVPTDLGGNFQVHYECVLGGVIVAEGDVAFDSAGGSQTITDIPTSNDPPPETVCTITEPGVNTDLYQPVLPDPVTLQTDETVEAVVTNNPAGGSLIITKTVVGGSDEEAQATFTVDYICTFNGETVATGSDVQISAALPIEIDDLPHGSTCAVTEDSATGFVATYTVDGSEVDEPAEVMISAGQSSSVAITNTRTKATFQLVKAIEGSVDGGTPDFDFVITCGDEEIEISGGPGSVYTAELPTGTQCSVEELAAAGFAQVGVSDDQGDASDGVVELVEVDGVYTVTFTNRQHRFDLALMKTLADGTNLATVEPGSDVTFTVTVRNQGNVDADDVVVVDYLPAGLTLNDPDWTEGAGGSATANIGYLGAGQSTTIDITVTVDAGATGQLNNWAEIASATPVDQDGNTIVGTNGASLIDVDSNADLDLSNDNQPGGPGSTTDDEMAEDGMNGGDEDDHDVAGVTVAEVVTTTTTTTTTSTTTTSTTSTSTTTSSTTTSSTSTSTSSTTLPPTTTTAPVVTTSTSAPATTTTTSATGPTTTSSTSPTTTTSTAVPSSTSRRVVPRRRRPLLRRRPARRQVPARHRRRRQRHRRQHRRRRPRQPPPLRAARPRRRLPQSLQALLHRLRPCLGVRSGPKSSRTTSSPRHRLNE